MNKLLALADRVEKLKEVECPFCGDDDFDLSGLAYHIAYYCEVHGSAVGLQRNTDIADHLRARAHGGGEG